SLEFFEDILIPTYLLQAPSEFNAAARQWVWKFGAEEGVDGEEGVTEFVMQQGDEIRFRVRTIHFTRVTSTAKGMVATTTSETSHSASGSTHSGPAGSSGDSEVTGGQHDMPAPQVHRRRSTSFDIDKEQNAPSAMQVVGCINEDGLGLTSWWGE
ncbi:POLR3H, partial [Symbiodinium microadriaticum]